MAFRPFSMVILLCGLILMTPYLSSEEVYRWTDEKGTIHFTDDVSKIPEKFRREAAGIDMTGERAEEDREMRESGKSREPVRRIDRVRGYLEKIDQKIEAKKKIENIDRGRWPPELPDEETTSYESAARAVYRSPEEGRKMLETHLERFPNGRYTKQIRLLIVAIDVGSWPPKLPQAPNADTP